VRLLEVHRQIASALASYLRPDKPSKPRRGFRPDSGHRGAGCGARTFRWLSLSP
jgi:hypothetical protein